MKAIFAKVNRGLLLALLIAAVIVIQNIYCIIIKKDATNAAIPLANELLSAVSEGLSATNNSDGEELLTDSIIQDNLSACSAALNKCWASDTGSRKAFESSIENFLKAQQDKNEYYSEYQSDATDVEYVEIKDNYARISVKYQTHTKGMTILDKEGEPTEGEWNSTAKMSMICEKENNEWKVAYADIGF